MLKPFSIIRLVTVLLTLAGSAWAEEPSPRTLSLEEALQTARANQPQLRQAPAGTEAARARADEARAPLLPQVNATANYQRATANSVARPGGTSFSSTIASISPSSRFDTFNFYNFGLEASMSVSTGLTKAGTGLSDLTWNWNANVLLSWPLFQGGLTRAQSREARANLSNLHAQVDSFRQQVRFEVDHARLAVQAAKAAIGATDEAVFNAQERLRLAEKRYETGVGNIIELADAQLALTDAESQKVQAEYNLASARARLLQALGSFQ